jgi:DNA-binding transcriptional regulator YbjK
MKKIELKKIISEAVLEVMYEQSLPIGVSSKAIIPIDQFVQRAQVDEAEGDFLGARTSTMSPEEMQAYLARIKSGEKAVTDKYKMPYIHGGNIEIKNDAGQSYDLDKLKASIMTRPKQILKQNAKMAKSAGEDTMFFDIGLLLHRAS